MKTEIKSDSFQKGFNLIPHGRISELKNEIMQALKIKSQPSWFRYLRGETELKPSQTKAIEEIFKSYGIKDIWGN